MKREEKGEGIYRGVEERGRWEVEILERKERRVDLGMRTSNEGHEERGIWSRDVLEENPFFIYLFLSFGRINILKSQNG